MKPIQWLNNLLVTSKSSNPEIRNIFFNLIQNNQGSIKVIDFAVAAGISGTEAKKILEKFAVEFDANFDVTEEGQVVYLFPTTDQPIPKPELSESQTNSPIIESTSDRKYPLSDLDRDLKRKVEDINNDVKRKVEDINNRTRNINDLGK